MSLFTEQNSYSQLFQILPKAVQNLIPSLSYFSISYTEKMQIFHREIFCQILYDVQVGLYFFFEKVDIIPIFPKIYCCYVQTNESEVMKSSNRDFSYLQFLKSYQKTSFKDNATVLVLYNFSP